MVEPAVHVLGWRANRAGETRWIPVRCDVDGRGTASCLQWRNTALGRPSSWGNMTAKDLPAALEAIFTSQYSSVEKQALLSRRLPELLCSPSTAYIDERQK